MANYFSQYLFLKKQFRDFLLAIIYRRMANHFSQNPPENYCYDNMVYDEYDICDDTDHSMDRLILTNQKTPNNFNCETCNYTTKHKKDFNKHLLTEKHKRLTKPEKNSYLHICKCGKKYVFSSSLCKHKKTCTFEIAEPTNFKDIKITTDFLIEFIKQNKDIQQTLIDQNKELQQTFIQQNMSLQQTLVDQNKTIIDLAQKSGTYNTTNNNSHNKTFNLQVFLNETCKDAINMSDFINQIQISLADLETTGQVGYAEGISKVFIKNLNDIEFSDRPIHCSDLKRETLYIKDNNEWLKDDPQKTKLTKAIKLVAHKNIKQISEWQKKYPDCSDPDSRYNDKYNQIVYNSMSGSTQEEADKNYEKIAKNIMKQVVIEK
jgi:hypothetical protein